MAQARSFSRSSSIDEGLVADTSDPVLTDLVEQLEGF